MQYLHMEMRDDIVLATLARPQHRNALNKALLGELRVALEAAEQNGTKVFMLTGEGRAFAAGADIAELASMDPSQVLQFCHQGQQVAALLERSPFLTIAAVNGYALGGGFEMALACDLVYASEQAQFGFPECMLGLIPGFGGTQRLARTVGLHKAKELIFTGARLSAEAAAALSLVNQVISAENLIEHCWKTAREINVNSFSALIQAKNVINSSAYLPMEESLELESRMCTLCFTTEECAKALHGFLSHRSKHA